MNQKEHAERINNEIQGRCKGLGENRRVATRKVVVQELAAIRAHLDGYGLSNTEVQGVSLEELQNLVAADEVDEDPEQDEESDGEENGDSSRP